MKPSHLVSGFHSRGKLPHLKREGAGYFVTFRLGDSLPHEVVEQLKHEREVMLQRALAAKRPLTWHEEQQLFLWYSEKVEAYLDAGHGACWLQQPAMADLVAVNNPVKAKLCARPEDWPWSSAHPGAARFLPERKGK